MTACEGCHKAKVKCDLQDKHNHITNGAVNNGAASLTSSCSRCQRLSIVCIRRISRQGQRPNNNNVNKKRKRSVINDEHEDGLAMGSEILKEINPQLLKRHYGVNFLIHHWTSMSFHTRNFSLLSRASELASKAGVSMDLVFSYQRREALEPLIWRQCSQHNNHNGNIKLVANDHTYRSPLQWSDIPQRLRQISQMPEDPNDQAFQQQRYFWVRESKDGQLRFLVTQAFSDEIASQWLLDQTFQANEQCVTQLLTKGSADLGKFMGAISFLVARYVDAETPPFRVRTNGLRIRYRSQPHQQDTPMSSSSSSSTTLYREMDMLACFEIVALDHSFFVAEFVFPTLSLTSAATATTRSLPVQSQSIPTNGRKEELFTSQIYCKNSISPMVSNEMTASPLRCSLVSFEGCPTLLEDLEMDDDLQQIFDLIQYR